MAVRCMGSAERLIILIECLPIISSLASLSYDLLARSLVAIADTHNYVRCAAAVAASVLFGHVLSLSANSIPHSPPAKCLCRLNHTLCLQLDYGKSQKRCEALYDYFVYTRTVLEMKSQ